MQESYLYKGYKEYHTKGIEARKQEKIRVKQLTELERSGGHILDELRTPIVDPEQDWLRQYGVAYAELKQRNRRKKDLDSTPYTPTNVVVDNNLDTGGGGSDRGAMRVHQPILPPARTLIELLTLCRSVTSI